MAWDSDTRIGIISSVTESKSIIRPGGTGPVGSAMAGPTFELGRIIFKIQNKTVNFLESKVYIVKRRPLLTGKRQIATAAFELGTLHSDSWFENCYYDISSATESYRNATYVWNQLFGKIHYLTEINVNLLLNTCNFHRKFRLIFPLVLSENAPNVDFREAKFQNFPGEHSPGPPSLLAPSALDTIWAGLTLSCFLRASYFQSVILTMILRILRIQKDVSFLSRKGCTSRIFQGLLTWGPLKPKLHPPPPTEKGAYAPAD